MTITALKELRKMPDDALIEWTCGWKETHANRLAGTVEIRRRQEHPNEIRGWISLFISTAAIVISIIALIVTGT